MAGRQESVRILEGGRIVIPARFRKELGLRPGDTVVVDIEGGELRIATRLHGIKRAQDLVRPYVSGTPSMADELIIERRAEADD